MIMNTQAHVEALLERTYSLLVDDYGNLKPRTNTEMADVANHLQQLASLALTPENRLKFEALHTLFEIRNEELET